MNQQQQLRFLISEIELDGYEIESKQHTVEKKMFFFILF